MPTDCYSYKKTTLAATPDGRLRIIYVSCEDSDMVVEEIVFARYFLKALRITAFNMYKDKQKGNSSPSGL